MWRPGRQGLALVLTPLLVFIAGVPALRDVQVTVPEAAAAGDTVTLLCTYNMETDSLYSIKWYRGREEFFRYIPKELPHTKVFPLQGIDVDVSRSGAGAVVLRGVTPALSGRFRCEVSADAPTFHTAMKTSYMHVVDLPEGNPIVTAEKTRVSVDDLLRARCTVPASYPPANITWLVNGKQIKSTTVILDADHKKPPKHSEIITFDSKLNQQIHKGNPNSDEDQNNQYMYSHHQKNNSKRENNPKTIDAFGSTQMNEEVINYGKFIEPVKVEKDTTKKRSGSSVELVITRDMFQHGQVKIVCKGSVFTLYGGQSEVALDEDKPHLALIMGKQQNANDAERLKISSMFSFIFILFLIKNYLVS